MPGNKSRFVLLCQQTLVVAVVAALAVPAADIVSLDIVAPPHRSAGGVANGSGGGVTTGAASTRSVVATATVRPTVSTVPFGGVSKAGLRALRPGSQPAAAAGSSHRAVRLAAATTVATPADGLAALSAPLHVGGLATVGVTWAKDVHVPDGDITVTVRTRRGST